MPRIQFPIVALLCLTIWNSYGQVLLGEKQIGKFETHDFGCDVDLSADGKVLAIGAFRSYDTAYHPGYVRILEWREEAWHQLGKDIETTDERDGFGYKVELSADGKTLVASAYDHPRLSVYRYQEGAWIQMGKDIYTRAVSQPVTDVAISDDGETIAYGVAHFPQGHIHRGVVRVFHWKENKWIQVGEDIEGSIDEIAAGWCVALSADGNTLALTALGDSWEKIDGYASVYVYQNNQWTQKGNTLWGKGKDYVFGSYLSLSADGNILAIGSVRPGEEHQSFVRVYSYSEETWDIIGQEISGYAKTSLSFNGRRITVARPSNETCPVIILDLVENQWVQMGVTLYPEFMYEYPGGAIAISKDGTRLASASIYSGGLVAVYDISSLEETSTEEICVFQDTLESNIPIDIFPNPTSGLLFTSGVDLFKLAEMHALQIYSMIGQEVNGQIVAENQMDISHLPSGMYMIQLNDFVEKIIKTD